MAGDWAGWIFISATLSENFASSFTLFEFRALNCLRIVSLVFVISASGSEFMILKVSLLEVCIFRVFVPGIAKQISSSKFLCPIIVTSAMSLVAYFAEQIRFRAASVLPLSILLWEYVRAMGLFRFCMKKDRADAV